MITKLELEKQIHDWYLEVLRAITKMSNEVSAPNHIYESAWDDRDWKQKFSDNFIASKILTLMEQQCVENSSDRKVSKR